MRTLFLHIGHGKTGSSYLQAAFRLGRERLANAGIAYPLGTDDWAKSAATITAGNGVDLLASETAFRERVGNAAATAEGCSLLWSSEFLFSEIERYDVATALPSLARDLGFERVRVLLFLRDPLGHATSGWQQDIKRGGATTTVEEAFKIFDFPKQVAKVLDRLDAAGIETTVRNYSRVQDRLLAEAAAWLGVSEAALPAPPVHRVNRSLTLGELLLQRELNRVLGPSHRILADPLCQRLPEVPADDVRPSLATQEATWARLSDIIEQVNPRLPESERYRPDLKPPPETKAASFSEEQLRVICESLGAEIIRLRKEKDRLSEILEDPAVHFGTRSLGAALLRRIRRGLRRRLSAVVDGRRPRNSA